VANFEIIVGSMLGASEYVADALAELLAKHKVEIHLKPDLQQLDPTAYWVICSSTHGAGELPDNIQPFARQLANTELADTKFAVIALGDSSYDTFCEGGKHLTRLMQNAKATQLGETYCIDVLEHPVPEENATEWFKHWLIQHSPE